MVNMNIFGCRGYLYREYEEGVTRNAKIGASFEGLSRRKKSG